MSESVEARDASVPEFQNAKILRCVAFTFTKTQHATLKMKQALGMLTLPAELRVEIYKLIGPTTIDFTYTKYSGLYLSCKTIHREMDVECAKRFHDEIHRIRQQPHVFILEPSFLDGHRYLSTPNTFAHLSNIKVEVVNNKKADLLAAVA